MKNCLPTLLVWVVSPNFMSWAYYMLFRIYIYNIYIYIHIICIYICIYIYVYVAAIACRL